MSESTSPQDDKLLAMLRRGLDESDPAPADVTDFAKAALSWQTIDADLAQLTHDSIEEPIPNGVRSVSTARMLSFEAGDWMIDIEYNEVTGRLMGQIDPAHKAAVEFHLGGNVLVTDTDELGRFTFDGVRSGPVAFVVRLEGDEVVKTEWIIL